jgi:hypothetical protein
METTIIYDINDDSGFYSRNEVLGSHTEHNPIFISIKVCIKTRLGLDYNSPWDESPHPPEKCHAVALKLVSESSRRNERSTKIFKIKVSIFRKKNANNIYNNKISKLDTKYCSLLY